MVIGTRLAWLAVVAGCATDKDDTGGGGDTDQTPTGTGTGAGTGSGGGTATGSGTGTGTGTGTGAGTGTGTGSSTGTGTGGLEIAGSWIDDWGTSHEIDETLWSQQFGSYDPLLFHVDSWSNPEGWLVAQNDAGSPYFPELYSRFDWTWSGERLYVCQVVYDAADAEAAEAAPGADEGDLDVAGCGGFPWSGLDPVSR